MFLEGTMDFIIIIIIIICIIMTSLAVRCVWLKPLLNFNAQQHIINVTYIFVTVQEILEGHCAHFPVSLRNSLLNSSLRASEIHSKQ
jgi:hypothetical protein